MKMTRKSLLIICIINCFTVSLFSQETKKEPPQKIQYTQKQLSMKVSAKDLRIIAQTEGEYAGGYFLYVKKLKGIESILLTETTRDPNGKIDNYAYRALEYNSINGDEIRYLDGKPLVSEGAKYSLVDSTAQKTDVFGTECEAFCIYIPKKIVFGYEWARKGEVEIGKGTFINIRTFEKPYADYTGDYMDSPFMFNFAPKKKDKPAPVVLTDEYSPTASQKFTEISEGLIYSKGPASIVNDISKILEPVKDKNNLDVVFAIDATGSMKNDIEELKKNLLPELEKIFAEASEAKLGLLFYRDYGDNFNYRNLPVKVFAFTSDLNTFIKNLNSIRINGKEGGDIPEAVYEAMYASVAYYGWRADSERLVILIGDAEPHPRPRGTGKYTKDYIKKIAAESNVKVTAILLPKDD